MIQEIRPGRRVLPGKSFSGRSRNIATVQYFDVKSQQKPQQNLRQSPSPKSLHTPTQSPAPIAEPTYITPSTTPSIIPEKKEKQSDKLTVAEHIQELRSRLLWSVLALLAGGVLGYIYHAQIIEILVRPLQQHLYYTSPAGGFDFLIKICMFFGFLATIPVLVFQLLKFLAPAIPNRVSYKTSKVLTVSVLLALAGVAFAYFVSLPAALHFLGNFSTGQITSLISANEYFNFVMIYMAGFAALFQMPLILAFINKITPLSPKMLMSKQRFVILGSFIVAAVLTPTPDPLNQTLMAMPIIALYQSSIGVVWQSNKRTRRRNRGMPMATSNAATA